MTKAKYAIKIEPQFKEDYQRLKQTHPELIDEVLDVIEQLKEEGMIDPAYDPHMLNKRGGNYNGNLEFHLADGKVDVLIIYRPHKTNSVIRLIRVGSHKELFRGKYN